MSMKKTAMLMAGMAAMMGSLPYGTQGNVGKTIYGRRRDNVLQVGDSAAYYKCKYQSTQAHSGILPTGIGLGDRLRNEACAKPVLGGEANS
jgi:hypothetical protein